MVNFNKLKLIISLTLQMIAGYPDWGFSVLFPQ